MKYLSAALLFIAFISFSGCENDEGRNYEKEILGYKLVIELPVGVQQPIDGDVIDRAQDAFKLNLLPVVESGNELDVLKEKRGINNLSQEFNDLLRKVQKYNEWTDNLYNPYLGRPKELWGFYSDSITTPSPDELLIAASEANETELYLNTNGKASLSGKGELGIRNIAVANAVDAAARELKNSGITIARVKCGNIEKFWGQPDVSQGTTTYWKYLFRTPNSDTTYYEITASDGAIVGILAGEDGFMFREIPHHKVLDSESGLPFKSPFGCVVWAVDASQAYAAAEALITMGVDKGLEQGGDFAPKGFAFIYLEGDQYIIQSTGQIANWMNSFVE